jgi:peptide/nickel transport system substrate-binding protein
MRSHSRALGAVVATSVAVTLIGCSAPVADEELTLRIAVAGIDVGSWDPAQGAGFYPSVLVADALFEGLGVWNYETYSVDPVLAESFDFADDGRSVDVVLHQDVDFVDGTHLDADGAVKYLEYVLDGDAWVLEGALAGYDIDFEVTGEYAFTISTGAPIYIPTSFEALVELPFVSPAAIDDPERANAEPFGSGPYVIEDVEPGASMTFVRNTDYRNPDAYPYDTIELIAIADPIAGLNALKTGQVDVVGGLPAEYASEAESSGLSLREFSTTVAYLNIRNAVETNVEALADVRVRHALMFAFDREAIAESLFAGYATPTIQAYAPGQPEYIEDAGDRYGYDPERARELLSEAGYPDGFDLVIPTLGGYTTILEPIVQQSLSDIGIRVTYRAAADFTEYASMAWGDGYDIGMTPGENLVNSTRLLDTEFPGLGRPFVPSPEIVELRDTIRGPDADAAAEAAQELGELLLDEVWYVPLVLPTTIWATIPEVVIDGDDFSGAVILRDFSPRD